MQDLQGVLGSLNLKAIYWVDDENAVGADVKVEKLLDDLAKRVATRGATSIANIISKAPAAWRPHLKKLQTALEADERKEEEERPDRTEQVASVLEKLVEVALTEDPDATKKTLATFAECVDGALTGQEKAALVSVFEPLAKQIGYKWEALSFSEWQTRQEQILNEHSADAPALILLDQQNTRDKAPIDGETILKNVCAKTTGLGFKFVMVTNTCTPEQEFAHSIDLARRFSIEHMGLRSPLFTLSKARITRVMGLDGGNAAAGIADHFVVLLSRLKLSILNQELTALVRKIVESAIDRAFARLGSMSLHEFLYAVTQSSQIEGTSELDTLLRLLAIEQRDALFADVGRDGALRRSIERIREFPVAIRKQELTQDAGLRDLRAREVFWPGNALNQLLQPLAAGDIFEYKHAGETTHYVLLGNDCDLMLRNTGERNTSFALLAQLVSVKTEPDAELECPLPQEPILTRVRLTGFLSMRAEILDLCWTNTKGLCTWEAAADIESLHLLPSQVAALPGIRRQFSTEARKHQMVASSPLKVTLRKNGDLDFKLKRVNRLSTPYAHGLVNRFAAVISRPSYEHDYASARDAARIQGKAQ